MRIVVLCVDALSLAGCEGGVGNVYKMPVARAYQKLMAAEVKPSGSGPFGRLDMQTTGKCNETVEWNVKGSNTPYCVATLKFADSERTRIDLPCKRGEGAIEGLQAKLIRNRVIEFVDATLKDRPFDPKSAEVASVASTWPEDPATKDATFGTAAAEALEMQQKTTQMIREMSSAKR